MVTGLAVKPTKVARDNAIEHLSVCRMSWTTPDQAESCGEGSALVESLVGI